MQFNPSAIPDDAYLNENSNRVDISDEDKKNQNNSQVSQSFNLW